MKNVRRGLAHDKLLRILINGRERCRAYIFLVVIDVPIDVSAHAR